MSNGSGSSSVAGCSKSGVHRLQSQSTSEGLRSMSTEDVFLEEQEDEAEAEDREVLIEEDEESEGDATSAMAKLVK